MIYRATVTQSGTNDPDAIVHAPAPAIEPVWTRHAEGAFWCNFGGAIDPDKLFVSATPREFPDEPFWIKSARVAQSGTAVEIRTAKVEDRIDCDNVEFYVEIRIDA